MGCATQDDWPSYDLYTVRANLRKIAYGVPSLYAIRKRGSQPVQSCDLKFDYGDTEQPVAYVSPRIFITLARTRNEILDYYHAAVDKKVSTSVTPVQPWWYSPIYTTWGDQVYTKHIEDGAMQSEAGAEKYCIAPRIDAALARLHAMDLHPKTIILDEGWHKPLGEWSPDDAKFDGSFKRYIAGKHAEGYRIILHFNPFLVSLGAPIVGSHPEAFVKQSDGTLKIIDRSARQYHVFDWSSPSLLAYLASYLTAMVSQHGLDADGIKISGTNSSRSIRSHSRFGVRLRRSISSGRHMGNSHNCQKGKAFCNHQPGVP